MGDVSDASPSGTGQPRPAGGQQSYPGQRLGLPADGPGSIAGWGRRIVALAVDWVASTLAASLVFGYQTFGDPAAAQGWVGATPLVVFLFEAAVLTALVGGSFGQLLLRIAVVRLDGRPLGLLQAFARTFLITLVIPPLVFNRDQRGLHDLAVGSVAIRR